MATVSLTKTTVDKAMPRAKDHFLWDSQLAGFGLKVTPAGGKTYIFQYRIAKTGQAQQTAPKRYTIGRHGPLTPEQARKRATELAYLASQGIDPKAQEKALEAAQEAAEAQKAEQARIESELAFAKVANRWLDFYANELQRTASSVRQARLVVKNHLQPALGSKPMPHIVKADVLGIIDGLPAQQQAMRRTVFDYAFILFRWAARRDYIPANPLAGVERPPRPKARKRFLTDAELVKVWAQTAKLLYPFGPYFRLLILTGQRRQEVARLNWAELDRTAQEWRISGERTKNGADHIVPLCRTAIAELDAIAVSQGQKKGEWPSEGYALTTTGETPISGISRAKAKLDNLVAKSNDGAPLEHWRIHDLRRTVATGMQKLGVRLEVTEATLNHISGSKSGIVGVYQLHDWKDEKRIALMKWETHLAGLQGKRGKAQVIRLPAAKRA